MPAEAHASLRKMLLACGVASSVSYVIGVTIGAYRWESYNSFSQTISELAAIDAPSRPAIVPFFFVYDVLLLAFAYGVWREAGAARRLRVSAVMLFAIALVGLVWPPMHMRGAVQTLTDTMHLVFAGIVVACTLSAIVLASSAFGPRFRAFSFIMLVLLLVTGALTSMQAPRLPANLPTPWMGVDERINVFGYLLWVAVLAVALWRRPERARLVH
jgi:hypothetical protein